MTKQERLAYIEQQTGMKVIDIEVEKFEKIYWGENGIIAIYNMRTGKLSFM